MSALIQVTGLYRYYGKNCVVKNLSFNLKKGQVLGFLGVNGAGKTTTLQMLSGNLAPSRGEIRIKNFDLLKQPLQAKRVLGYLPEVAPLYRDLSVDEFLNYCAQLHRVSKPLIRGFINDTKERCGLTNVARRLIMNLSKGYQQRVGIAQAILHKPDIIIFDEPMVGLDPVQIKEIRHLIKNLGEDHGVILSSHLLSEVQESCSDVQIIHNGELILKETITGLNKQMNYSRLKLTTRVAINIEELRKINALTEIESLAGNQYLIRYKSNDNPIETLTNLVISKGWGLEEIAILKCSLEDIFLTLTKNTT